MKMSDTIENLIFNIKKSGIKTFALTDHDTVAGCNEVISKLPSDIKFIPSIELTCKEDFVKCHILGYNCDFRNKKLLDLNHIIKEITVE